jgi:hypothetical protein
MSQILENLKAKGEVSIVLNREDGSVENIDINNLVVSTGLNFIVSRMKDTSLAAMSHMELGTGTTAAANADTTLQTAISGSRQALGSTSVSGNQITYVASFPAGTGTGAVTEAGIFNASSAGVMACRTVFPVVNKQAGDSMTVTWTVTVS